VIVTRDNCTDSDTSGCIVIDQLGTQESTLPAVTVYPNPLKSGGKLSVTAQAAITGLTIYTTDGRLVKTIRQDDLQPGTTLSFDLPELPEGTYFLVAMTSGGLAAQTRFVVAD
jgi:hypothetical protein